MRRVHARLLFVAVLAACGDAAPDASIGWYDDVGSHDVGGDTGVQEPETTELGQTVTSRSFVVLPDLTGQSLALLRVRGSETWLRRIELGLRPEIVVASPDSDRLLIVESLQASALWIDLGDDATVVARRADLRMKVNRAVVSPGQSRAVLWFDATADNGSLVASPLDQVAVLDLSTGATRAELLPVGLGIRDVVFCGETSFAVETVDGLSRVSLGGEINVTSRAWADDAPPLELDADLDIVTAPGCGGALARLPGRPGLQWVALEPPVTETIEPATAFSDLDRAGPEEVVAVDRIGRRVALSTLGNEGTAPTLQWLAVDGASLGWGAASPDGRTYFVTGGVEGANRLVAIDIASRAVREFTLEKFARSLSVSPDGNHLFVVHGRRPGQPVAGEPITDLIAKSPAVSLIDLRDARTSFVRLDVDATAATWVASADAVLLALPRGPGASARAVLVTLEAGPPWSVDLASEPQQAGTVPGSTWSWISQSHPLGRITLVDTAANLRRQITGFGLNSYIE